MGQHLLCLLWPAAPSTLRRSMPDIVPCISKPPPKTIEKKIKVRKQTCAIRPTGLLPTSKACAALSKAASSSLPARTRSCGTESATATSPRLWAPRARLFDQRDRASITAPGFPGKRQMVCSTPDRRRACPRRDELDCDGAVDAQLDADLRDAISSRDAIRSERLDAFRQYLRSWAS